MKQKLTHLHVSLKLTPNRVYFVTADALYITYDGLQLKLSKMCGNCTPIFTVLHGNGVQTYCTILCRIGMCVLDITMWFYILFSGYYIYISKSAFF